MRGVSVFWSSISRLLPVSLLLLHLSQAAARAAIAYGHMLPRSLGPSLSNLARVLADAHIAHHSSAFPPAETDRQAQHRERVASARADAVANANATCARSKGTLTNNSFVSECFLMRQVPLKRDINIAVNGFSGFATSTQKWPFTAKVISRSRGTCPCLIITTKWG